mgnify:CR=1 FL=1
MLIKKRQQGFAALEAILIVIIIAAIAGVGGWVYTQKTKTSSTVATPTASIAPTKLGTTDAIEQLTKQEGASEASIDTKHESDEQTTSQSANPAQKDLGGAYDETTLEIKIIVIVWLFSAWFFGVSASFFCSSFCSTS